LERWWDGQQWTEHCRPAIVATQLLPSVQQMPQYQPPMQMQPTAYPFQTVAPYGRMSDQRTNTVEVVFAWIFTVITLLYMLPWAVAATRGKSNSAAIGVLNFFLGWSLIGWIAAMVMACSAHQQTGNINVVQMVNNPQPPYYHP
jgi:hypothetical protein